MRIIPFLLLFSACSFSQNNSNENKMECLSDSQEQIVNNIIVDFESQMVQEYGQIDYGRFLIDIREFALPPEFFIDSDGMEFLQSIKANDEFKDLFKFQDGEYIINSAGAFNECLKKKSDSQNLKEIIETTEQLPLSPGIIAGALSDSFSQDELNEATTRAYIALNLYALFGLNIYDRFK